MNVKILYVKDHGHADERIVLQALEDTDMGEYLVLDTTYTNEHQVSNKARHPYWFPDKAVKKGDFIVLYTKKGTSSSSNNNNTTTHFFYWGLDSNVWNDDGDAAVLMHVREYALYRAKPN